MLNSIISDKLMMPEAGLEPARPLGTRDFKSIL